MRLALLPRSSETTSWPFSAKERLCAHFLLYAHKQKLFPCFLSHESIIGRKTRLREHKAHLFTADDVSNHGTNWSESFLGKKDA